MVDFSKRLAHAPTEKPLSPAEIYQRLDRASDKGPLRPAQSAILDEWHSTRRQSKDVVLKLHTGEGKTLVGLLMLQSKLNERPGRALYLCPNHFLVEQTLDEARAFGIGCVPVEDSGELPAAFLDGQAILVAPVQKLFNGRTRFGLAGASLKVESLVLDDAHACIDAIKDACVITLDRADIAYETLSRLFETDLQDQGAGSYAELRHDEDSAAFLPVPYWSWLDRHHEVAEVLALHSEQNSIKFAWPLLRDRLRYCQCIVSGRDLVIAPFRSPLELFGSYAQGAHRIFMSATLTDDSFLVKGFGLTAAAVQAPLTFAESRWSGEKMVLIPSIIHDSLISSEVVELFANPLVGRTFGIVALVPSREASKAWAASGAIVTTKDSIDEQVKRLRTGQPGNRDKTIVIVNRYDGIDLPDNSCRILVLDGKPFGEGLLDRYVEGCRPGSDLIAGRVARVIEQGMGRAVRGEKDYCVVVLSRGDLVKAVRTREGRSHLSEQTRTQIEIGLEVATFAREELSSDRKPLDILRTLVNQSLKRDEGWKAFYAEKMGAMRGGVTAPRLLPAFTAELEAELLYEQGDFDGASARLQRLLNDSANLNESDKGWYLQEMARYQYSSDKAESNRLQIAAHQRNRYLLKPRHGITVRKLTAVGQQRVQRIQEWIRSFETSESLMVSIDDLIGCLRFGVRADTFERALDDLAHALGFQADRPDKEWKAGPDNLWALREGEYLLFECKSEVEVTRAEIARSESGQINNAAAWFSREYRGAACTRVLVIPTRNLASGAGFNDEVLILRAAGLHQLTRNVRAFFGAFRNLDLRDIADTKVQSLLNKNELGIEALRSTYYEQPRPAPLVKE